MAFCHETSCFLENGGSIPYKGTSENRKGCHLMTKFPELLKTLTVATYVAMVAAPAHAFDIAEYGYYRNKDADGELIHRSSNIYMKYVNPLEIGSWMKLEQLYEFGRTDKDLLSRNFYDVPETSNSTANDIDWVRTRDFYFLRPNFTDNLLTKNIFRLERTPGDEVLKRQKSYKMASSEREDRFAPVIAHDYYTMTLAQYLKSEPEKYPQVKKRKKHEKDDHLYHAPDNNLSEYAFFADYWPAQDFMTGSIQRPMMVPVQESAVTEASFLGKPIKSLVYSKKLNFRANFGASGIYEVDEFEKSLRSEYDKVKRQSRVVENQYCSASDVSNVVWSKVKYANFTHPIMFRAVKKADLESAHDYSLNLAKYVGGKTLYVASERAKASLEKKLSSIGVEASVVIGGSKGPGSLPLDDTYFAVERLESELPSLENDYFGYNSDLDTYYRMRYAKIDDVRFERKRKPIDAFFADIAEDRGVETCAG